MTITTQEEFNEFMEKAEQQEFWNDTEIEDWKTACKFAGINCYDYDDPDTMWNDLCKAWKEVKSAGD